MLRGQEDEQPTKKTEDVCPVRTAANQEPWCPGSQMNKMLWEESSKSHATDWPAKMRPEIGPLDSATWRPLLPQYESFQWDVSGKAWLLWV